MKLTTGRYSIVSMILLTAVVALSISLYQTRRWLRSATAGLSSAWQTRWPDPDHLNVLLTTEATEIVDYEDHTVSASWQALVPTTGAYCIQWRAGHEVSPKFLVLPGAFSRIDLRLHESSGPRLNLEIGVDGENIDDQLGLHSPLISKSVSFSIAGMGQTYRCPPNRRFPLLHLRGDSQNLQNDVEIWIAACIPQKSQSNQALNSSSVGASSLPVSRATKPR